MLPPSAPKLHSIKARNIACERGGSYVFSGISFELVSGGLLAVTGPNGVGKSTLLRVLGRLLELAAGTLWFEGHRRAHYLGHADAVKPALTLRETLRFWAALHAARDEAVLAHAAERVGLGHALDLSAGVLSAGQRRRAGLARLLLAPRPLWLLDEPASALDREGEALLGRLLEEHLAAGGLAVVAAHQDLPVRPTAVLDLGAAA